MKWSKKDHDYLMQHCEKLPVSEIALHLKRSERACYNRASLYGLSLSTRTETLCWTCAHAVPTADASRGCSWSRTGKPVVGWKAVSTIIQDSRGQKHDSYHVMECSEYAAEEWREKLC